MRDLSRLFKALSDEARLQMLWLLMNQRELCVCDVMAALDITQSKASRHLRTLLHAGLVADRREGLWSYYALRRDLGPHARAQLRALKTALAGRPEARASLERLGAWTAEKSRGAGCRA
jgi:ArsR family transcriptional regulator, arsenate/arsenite/antimonite-responsive transcriptional repressor